MIETCKTALAMPAKDKPDLDNNTMAVARALLEKAKSDVPNDKILAAATLDGPLSWMAILSAMETVHRSLPLERA